MNFELTDATEEYGKEIIFNLMQLYTYELSFFEDETTNFELQDNGLYVVSKYTELYWKEDKRHPYVLKCDGEIAGFVLERLNEEGMNEIAEFFVLNKYRKLGAGTFMANEMFKRFKGKWEIQEDGISLEGYYTIDYDGVDNLITTSLFVKNNTDNWLDNAKVCETSSKKCILVENLKPGEETMVSIVTSKLNNYVFEVQDVQFSD